MIDFEKSIALAVTITGLIFSFFQIRKTNLESEKLKLETEKLKIEIKKLRRGG